MDRTLSFDSARDRRADIWARRVGRAGSRRSSDSLGDLGVASRQPSRTGLGIRPVEYGPRGGDVPTSASRNIPENGDLPSPGNPARPTGAQHYSGTVSPSMKRSQSMDSRYETMGRAGPGKKLVAGRRQLWSGMIDHAEVTVERPGTLAESTASQTVVGRIPAPPSSGRPPLQTTGGSYRRRSSGSPAMTKEGVHPGTSGVPPRTASRILRPTSSMRNRRASDSAVGSSSESAVRRSLSQGLALEYQQTSTKPLSRSDLAASSERLMSVARPVVDHPGAVRSYSSFRGEKWGERRDSVPPSDQREQPPNHEVSKQMRSNGPVSLRASLLDLTGEGGTAPERFQQPWKRVEAIEHVVEELFSAPKFILGKYETQAMADGALQKTGLSEEEKGKLHWTFISWALPGKLDPYEMPQFGRKPEISSSDGIPCGNFVSLLRASKLVDGKRVTVSMLHNIFENYHDKESKLMTYPQFILSLGEIMELNFWPLKRILQSILRSQRSY